MFWKDYGRPLLLGFLPGAVLGFVQPYSMGVKDVNPVSHFILAAEMGMAFAILGLLLSRYYGARRRIYRKLTEGRKPEDQATGTG